MLSHLKLACSLLLALRLIAASQDATAQSEPAGESPQASRWIIAVTDPRSGRRRGWSTGPGYSGTYNYASDPALERLADDLTDRYPVSVTEQWPVRALRVHCIVVTLNGDTDAILASLRSDERVEWVQPFNEFEVLSSEMSASDPYRHLQSSLEMMNVEPLQSRLSGHGISIVVIDSGVEPDHPDLQHALVEQMDFVGHGRMSERHGTGVAGVMIAAHGNNEGIVGVAPDVRLHAYRACWETSDGGARCNSLTLSRALDEAVRTKPRILNLSLTGPRDPLLDRLVEQILDAGSIVVAAHDARRPARSRFPSPRPGVVAVWDGTGIAKLGERTVYAPGGTVLTAQPGHSYDFMNGASFAAAHVSAVLALMLEVRPDMDAVQMISTLTASARFVGDGASIDACKAVRRSGLQINCPEPIAQRIK
ncbi:MAG: S8 family serine peptidase [Pseudomonadota bacterium]